MSCLASLEPKTCYSFKKTPESCISLSTSCKSCVPSDPQCTVTNSQNSTIYCLQSNGVNMLYLFDFAGDNINNSKFTTPDSCIQATSDALVCTSNNTKQECYIQGSWLQAIKYTSFTGSSPMGGNAPPLNSLFVYLIIPVILFAVLLPCLFLRLKNCLQKTSGKPIVSSTSIPLEIVHEDKKLSAVHSTIETNVETPSSAVVDMPNGSYASGRELLGQSSPSSCHPLSSSPESVAFVYLDKPPKY